MVEIYDDIYCYNNGCYFFANCEYLEVLHLTLICIFNFYEVSVGVLILGTHNVYS